MTKKWVEKDGKLVAKSFDPATAQAMFEAGDVGPLLDYFEDNGFDDARVLAALDGFVQRLSPLPDRVSLLLRNYLFEAGEEGDADLADFLRDSEAFGVTATVVEEPAGAPPGIDPFAGLTIQIAGDPETIYRYLVDHENFIDEDIVESIDPQLPSMVEVRREWRARSDAAVAEWKGRHG